MNSMSPELLQLLFNANGLENIEVRGISSIGLIQIILPKKIEELERPDFFDGVIKTLAILGCDYLVVQLQEF